MAEADRQVVLDLLGERLRELREKSGMTQGEAAEKIGLMVRERAYSYSTVNKIESGRVTVKSSRENLEAYARILGTTLERLLDDIEQELRKKKERPVLDKPKIPVGFPMVSIPFAGEVPCSSEWGDPLASEDFIEVEVQFEGPRRFAAKVAGDSCWPALQPGDVTIWEEDANPPYGVIVIAQRQPDHGCTVKELAYDEKEMRPQLMPVNPKHGKPEDGEGWRVIARLVAVLRSGETRRTWFAAHGIRPSSLL